MLGLTTTKTFQDGNFHNRNYRRKIFHDYPVGSYPLTALLSLIETEETDSCDFGWFEKRYKQPETKVAGGDRPFSPSGTDTGTDSLNIVKGTVYRVKVASSAEFMPRQIIAIDSVKYGGGVTTVSGVIESIPNSSRIEFRANRAVTAVVNTDTASPAGAVDSVISVTGNSSAEGSSAALGRLLPPIRVSNYTQIFRNPFSFTRSALKQPTDFDKTGVYKEKSKDAMLDHMTAIEMSVLFGNKTVDYVEENGETTPRRQMGGVLWFLEQYEMANSVYRGGAEAGAPAITDNIDDDKRIIDCGGSITDEEWDRYLERLFHVNSDKTFEKLILGGSGVISAINSYLTKAGVLYKQFKAEDTYGMNVTSWETPHGTVHFGSHPLFTRMKHLRYNAFALDVQNILLRPLNDSDTALLDNRQPRDYDGRKDEWLSELGLEVRLPESCMYFINLREITQG